MHAIETVLTGEIYASRVITSVAMHKFFIEMAETFGRIDHRLGRRRSFMRQSGCPKRSTLDSG
jgi:hypothetical protein